MFVSLKFVIPSFHSGEEEGFVQLDQPHFQTTSPELLGSLSVSKMMPHALMTCLRTIRNTKNMSGARNKLNLVAGIQVLVFASDDFCQHC